MPYRNKQLLFGRNHWQSRMFSLQFWSGNGKYKFERTSGYSAAENRTTRQMYLLTDKYTSAYTYKDNQVLVCV